MGGSYSVRKVLIETSKEILLVLQNQVMVITGIDLKRVNLVTVGMPLVVMGIVRSLSSIVFKILHFEVRGSTLDRLQTIFPRLL